MDLLKIQSLYEEALRTTPPVITLEDTKTAESIVQNDELFTTFLTNLNIDYLKDYRADFAKDDDIVKELDNVIDFINEQLNDQNNFRGHIVKVGSCIDDSKVFRINEADTLFVMNKRVKVEDQYKECDGQNELDKFSYKLKGVLDPREFVSQFADCINSIMEEWSPSSTSKLSHGGYRSPAFGGVRFSGPAVTLLFTHNKETELSLDITPTFELPDTCKTIRNHIISKISILQQVNTEKIYDKTGIFLFPNVITDFWQITTACIEANLLRDLPSNSPLKQTYNSVKILSYWLNKANKHIFNALTYLTNKRQCTGNEQPRSCNCRQCVESYIISVLNWQKSMDIPDAQTMRCMRYGYAVLCNEYAERYDEMVKPLICINTTVLKYILLHEAFINPEYSANSLNLEDDVYKLLCTVIAKLTTSHTNSIPHAFLENNISIFSISKQSLLDGMSSRLQCVLKEECRKIMNKIDTQTPSDVLAQETSLKDYLVPDDRIPTTSYQYKLPIDVSISPKRNPRVTHINVIINGCMNSSGGKILVPIEYHDILQESVRAKWEQGMRHELTVFEQSENTTLKLNDDKTLYTIDITPTTPIKTLRFPSVEKTFKVHDDGSIIELNLLDNCQSSQNAPEAGTSAHNDTTVSEHQLQMIDSMTWSKNNKKWTKYLKPTNLEWMKDYKVQSKAFTLAYPLNVYPSTRQLSPELKDKLTSLSQQHREYKGMMFWSNQFLTLFDLKMKLPERPAGHQLDVLCVWGQDVINFNLWCLVDGSKDEGAYSSYLEHTTHVIKHHMTKKIRENDWVTSAEGGSVFDIRISANVFRDRIQLTMSQQSLADSEKQLASLSLALLDKDCNITLRAYHGESISYHLSIAQKTSVLEAKQYNFISGPPGSGKSVIALYICGLYDKQNVAFFCTTDAYKAFIAYQNKSQVFLITNLSQLVSNIDDRKLQNISCLIIDDSHNLQCDKRSFKKLFKFVESLDISLFIFGDCTFQNYKQTNASSIINWMAELTNGYNYQCKDLSDIFRNSRKIASFLSAGITKGNKPLTCKNDDEGNDVTFKKTGSLTSWSKDNGVLQCVKSLINPGTSSDIAYKSNQIAILLDCDSHKEAKKIKLLLHEVLETHLPDVCIHGATQFPREGIVLDYLETFMGLDAHVCIFPVFKRKSSFLKKLQATLKTSSYHNILDLKYKTFVASRAVDNMIFLMEEVFDTTLTSNKFDSFWVPDYKHTGRPRVYGREGRGDGELGETTDVAVCPQTGRLVITDSSNDRIHIVTADLEHIATFGSSGARDSQYRYPWGVTVSDAGEIYVADSINDRIQIHGPDGTYRRRLGLKHSGSEKLIFPHGITWCNGHIYICDKGNARISVWDKSGCHVKELSVPAAPRYIAASPDGKQLAVTCDNKLLHLMTPDGETIMTEDWDRHGSEPSGVCFDRYGNVIVADVEAGCLHVRRQDRWAVCDIGTKGRRPGELYKPRGLALTNSEEIAVANSANHCVLFYPVPGMK